MRHNQNRRSRGRNRKGPNPLTRSYESNGPDVKVRGTAAHVAEKYMTLARDAQSSGDSVAAENYLQHAEHYIRIVMTAQAQLQPVQPNQVRDGQDDFDDDDRQMNGRIRDRFDSNGRDGRAPDDDSFDGEEGDEEDRSFPPAQQFRPNERPNDRQNQPRQDDRGFRPDDRGPRADDRGQFRNDDRGPRNDDRGPRNEDRGPRPDDRGPRQDGSRQDGPRQDNRGPQPARFHRRDRPDRGDSGPRQDRPDNGPRPERFEAQPRVERFDRGDEVEARPEMNGVEVAQLEESAVPMPDEAPEPVRRRRGRPPRAVDGAATADDAAEVTPDGAAALAAFPE